MDYNLPYPGRRKRKEVDYQVCPAFHVLTIKKIEERKNHKIEECTGPEDEMVAKMSDDYMIINEKGYMRKPPIKSLKSINKYRAYDQEQSVTNLLDYCIKNKDSHIPSALSHFETLQSILQFIDKDWNIVAGKGYGQSAWRLALYYNNWISKDVLNSKIETPIIGTDVNGRIHEDFNFIDYTSDYLGNSLGHALGLAQNGKKTICFISDGETQTGAFKEAYSFMMENRRLFNDLYLIIDMNCIGLTDKITSPDIDTNRLKGGYIMRTSQQLNVLHNIFKPEPTIKFKDEDFGPTVLVCSNIKGQGIERFEFETKYHYKVDEAVLDECFEEAYQNEVENPRRELDHTYFRAFESGRQKRERNRKSPGRGLTMPIIHLDLDTYKPGIEIGLEVWGDKTVTKENSKLSDENVKKTINSINKDQK